MTGVNGYKNEILKSFMVFNFDTDSKTKTKEALKETFGEDLFEMIESSEFSGDIIEFSDEKEKEITGRVDEILSQIIEESNNFNGFIFNFGGFHFGKKPEIENRNSFGPKSFSFRDTENNVNDAEKLSALWRQNKGTSSKRTADDSVVTDSKTTVSTDGLAKIRTLKSETTETTDVQTQQENITAVIEPVETDPLEGKNPEEKKAILEQTMQTQKDDITSIQNGSNEEVQSAQASMQSAEEAMNAAIDRDTNINEEVKTQIKESEAQITAKSQEVSAKEAEIAATEASITQTQGTISNLQSALSSLASPSGKEEDKEKDAKLAARRAELESQIAAKQAELAQLEAQKQQQETEKTQLEGQKGELESLKDQIVSEELKDASPSTKAAIKAYDNARANVETTKTNELQKAQDALNETMQKLNEVEAEIEQSKNASANTNFDINGMIEAFAQGQTSDCWLLSSLQALSNSEEGKKILQDAIKVNEDGTYTVKFDGVDWEQTFTDADLRAARNSGLYSSGDDDVLLMEVAMENCLAQIRNGEVKLPEDSACIELIANSGTRAVEYGNTAGFYQMLTGDTGWLYGSQNFDANKEIGFDEFFDKIEQNDSSFATVSFVLGDKGILNTANAGTVATGADAYAGHQWSVKSVDGEKVTLVNPWNSNQEIVTTRTELAQNNTELFYKDLAA